MKLLFVCTGNTCRSVMAEQLLKKLAKDKGLGWSARSCGTAAERHFPIPSGVLSALKAAGVGPFTHVPRLVSRDLLGWSDLVLAMTRQHRALLADQFPEASPKLKTLRGFAGLPGEDIADPIGEPDEVYAECRDRIQEALEVLVERHEHA